METPAELLDSLTSTVLCPPSLKAEAACVASCLVACSWRLCCQASTRNRSVFWFGAVPRRPLDDAASVPSTERRFQAMC